MSILLNNSEALNNSYYYWKKKQQSNDTSSINSDIYFELKEAPFNGNVRSLFMFLYFYDL